MALSRICSTCGAANAPSDMLCARCFGDISGIAPTEQNVEHRVEGDDAGGESLALVTADGSRIVVADGDEVGRSGVGKEALAPFEKVSRRQARFRRAPDGWRVQDLGSANGTFVDGVRVPAGEQVPVASGQRIRFSSTFEAVVVTEKGAKK